MQRSLQWLILKEWARRLNANDSWIEALNAALDTIGFTSSYIEEVGASAHTARTKAVKDSVWGMIELTPVACVLLDTPLLQRLRFIRQLGFSYLTYPNATHSRFEHSLGTYWVVRKLLDSAARLVDVESSPSTSNVFASSPSEDTQALMCMAALLHDIGHGPFSHALEAVLEGNPRKWKVGPFTIEDFTRTVTDATMSVPAGSAPKPVPTKNFCELFAAAIIVSPRFRQFFRALPLRHRLDTEEAVVSLASLLLGQPIYTNSPGASQVISGPIDADKLDYIVRDAQACGISISLDISRVLFRAGFYKLATRSLHPHSDNLEFEDAPVEVFVIEQSGTDALRELAMSRLSLYSRVYYHQCTRNAEKVFARALDLASTIDFLHLWTLGDEQLLGKLREDDRAGVAAMKL